MRSVGVGSLIGLGCILALSALGACSEDPAAGGGADDEKEGGASSSSSSGGSSGKPGDDDDSDGGDAGSDLVPVGDGSLGAGCNKDDECNSKVCAVGRKCVAVKSCRASNGKAPGVDTCGAGETASDSCCKSLTLPTTKTRTLDKYEITSGRVRAFIEDLAKSNGGNLRKFVTDYAAANPTSQLGKLLAEFPGYDVVLPSTPRGGDALLAAWLGAFPQDAMNVYDGCYLSAGGYGAATYWQEPGVLKDFGIGYTDPGDGVRKYGKDVLDAKPANCMPPMTLAAFCAWDGGELATTSDFREVHGRQSATVGGATVFHPWSTLLQFGEFNWANGHGAACPITGWPGCGTGANPTFYAFPQNGNQGDDDSITIGAPGRFPKDVTKAVSEDGNEGWFDIGGNLLEAMWPQTQPAVSRVPNFCDTTAQTPGAGEIACNRAIPDGVAPELTDNRARPGTVRYRQNDAGRTPSIYLQGYSFEGHARSAEAYLASETDDEAALANLNFPAHFQYGKVGGRCARIKK